MEDYGRGDNARRSVALPDGYGVEGRFGGVTVVVTTPVGV